MIGQVTIGWYRDSKKLNWSIPMINATTKTSIAWIIEISMMSEVKAPCDCDIEAILQEDGALVSFGDNLIRYREG